MNIKEEMIYFKIKQDSELYAFNVTDIAQSVMLVEVIGIPEENYQLSVCK